ncbi:MAG: Ni/Fe-hydrogenase, b-type cytochrome subunit [Nitrospirota bacterium]
MAKQKVYHWTTTIRLHHWINLLALAVLVFTGFYIYSPFLSGGTETMGWIRWFHLLAAYVVVFALIVRIYLMFNSRAAADWKELLPLPRNLANIPDVVLYYMFVTNKHKHYERYNPLQALAYVFMGVMILVMAVTGFALHTGWLHSSFDWVNGVLGGEPNTRVVHFLGMWLLIVVTLVHLYFAIRQNACDKDRCLMSMIDGYCLKDSE